MDSEERPTKMRKLDNQPDESSQAPSKSEANPAPTSQEPAQNAEESQQPDASHQETIQIPPPQDLSSSLPPPTTTAPLLTSHPSTTTTPPLSKSQQKKLKRRAEWEANRDSRKAYRKEKQTAKRERIRAAKAALASDPNNNAPAPSPPKSIPRAIQLPITIMIDCNFDNLMHEGERTSLSSQITRCYSDNKGSPFRAHLVVCSFGGKLRERFDNVLLKTYESWKGVRYFEEGFKEVAGKAKEWMESSPGGGKLAGAFEKYADLEDDAEKEALKAKGEVVYLTSEASEDLTELKPYSTYIIGGLVDKNREKGICYKRAKEARVKTARLPIGSFMEMQSRKVLATNHVNEIMMKWLECGDWAAAFMKAIPKRKGGKLKGAGAGGGDGEVDAKGSKNGEGGDAGEGGDDDDGDEDEGLGGIEGSAATEDVKVEQQDQAEAGKAADAIESKDVAAPEESVAHPDTKQQ